MEEYMQLPFLGLYLMSIWIDVASLTDWHKSQVELSVP
jgi:hypothetical protein